MKFTYIKLNKKNDEKMLMKHLRYSENKDKSPKLKKYFNDSKKFLKKDFLTKKIIKKNQVVLATTALMLVTAGYLNYTNNIKMAALGDAQLVSTNVIETNQLEPEQQEMEQEETTEAIETTTINEENITETVALVPNGEETIQTSTNTKDDDYFTKTKLERETMYSQMLETYKKILENDSIPNDQKTIASNEIKNINDKKSAIATAENLIKIKGNDDVAILINDKSINVVVKSEENLEKEKVAQIQNIISRELNSNIEDIHITTHQ